MFSKEHILAEINRTASENDGTPLGKDRFQAATGIAQGDIMRFWARFSDAIAEAGLTPNELKRRTDDGVLLEKLAELARELGKFPVGNEIKLKARQVKGFPWAISFQRFGPKPQLVARLLAWSLANGQDDVAEICRTTSVSPPRQKSEQSQPEANITEGFVYLAKSGQYFKIGFTNAVGRRGYELQIQLPEKTTVVHQIATDDPRGIEQYWHRRFDAKRANGEFFRLNASDVAAFKRRKFM